MINQFHNKKYYNQKSYYNKKRYLLLPQMLAAMFLLCACSAGEPRQAPPISEMADAAATGFDAPKQSEADAAESAAVGTESAKTAAGEANAVQTEAAETETGQSDREVIQKLAPDLNHNGIPEEVLLTDIEDGQELEIRENGVTIDREIGHNVHAGQTSVFLCTLDEEDYLLRYHPTMYQGVGSYHYSLSSFTDNRETVDRRNEIEFDINFGSPVHTGFDAEAVAAFMDEINDLLTHSVQLLNTENDLSDTFRREGRLYDSLWWLDGFEPEFVRDESKSLRENLEAFQATMTAQSENAVYEEAGGLPVKETLQMRFFSGAGGWQTYLELNPDGSFTGDYQDADVDMVTLCRFEGRFGKVEKLTDASWRLTLAEMELTTGRNVGEEWDEKDGEYGWFHCKAGEPYGFDGLDWKALKPGALFILYSPDAAGYEPGTELYGAKEFQSWMHKRRGFTEDEDTLGCWGLQNMETGYGFFSD